MNNQQVDITLYHGIDQLDNLVANVQRLATELNWRLTDSDQLVARIRIYSLDESTVSVSFWTSDRSWVCGFGMTQPSLNWELATRQNPIGRSDADHLHYLYQCQNSAHKLRGAQDEQPEHCNCVP